jgi:hypothetical protein
MEYKELLKKINMFKFKNGFTILEVITAIFILNIGLGGAFNLISQTLFVSSIVKSQLIGAYLAQEGVEIVRNIRDANWLERTVLWDYGLNNCQPCCEGDYKTGTSPFSPFSSLGDCDYDDLNYLNIDDDGFYSYSPGSPTKFKRKISIQETSTTTLEVLVDVIWKERGRIHNIEVSEVLTNWANR